MRGWPDWPAIRTWPGRPASERRRSRPGPRPRRSRREQGLACREMSADVSASLVTLFMMRTSPGANITSDRGRHQPPVLESVRVPVRRLFRQNTNNRPDTPPLIGQKDPDPSVVGPDIAPVSGIFSVPVHAAAMRSCGRARGSITTAHILVPAGRRTVNWADPGGTGDFLATPRAGDRQASASTTNSTARACVVIGAHTLEQGRSQGLRALRRQSRRNNAEYPVRYGSHGYRNELGLATIRRISRVARPPSCHRR